MDPNQKSILILKILEKVREGANWLQWFKKNDCLNISGVLMSWLNVTTESRNYSYSIPL